MSGIRNTKGPHRAEHELGGIDALTTLDGGLILTGTIPDARLSANTSSTWTPVDASGAGLTFTSGGVYVAIGKLVLLQCSITWPTTSNSANAQVGGLPFTASNQFAMNVGYSELSSIDRGLIQVSQTYFFIYQPTGVAVTNAQMSAKTTIFSGFYFR